MLLAVGILLTYYAYNVPTSALHPSAHHSVAINSNKSVILQDFNPKLSDFGLAKYGPHDHETHVSTRVLGTKGYVAPEYIGTGTFNSNSGLLYWAHEL